MIQNLNPFIKEHSVEQDKPHVRHRAPTLLQKAEQFTILASPVEPLGVYLPYNRGRTNTPPQTHFGSTNYCLSYEDDSTFPLLDWFSHQ